MSCQNTEVISVNIDGERGIGRTTNNDLMRSRKRSTLFLRRKSKGVPGEGD